METFIFFHAEILDMIVSNTTSDAEDLLEVVTEGWIGTKVVTWDTQSGSILIVGLAFFLWSYTAIDRIILVRQQFASAQVWLLPCPCTGNSVLVLVLTALAYAVTKVTRTRMAATKRGGLDMRVLMKVGRSLEDSEREDARGLMVATKAPLQL